MLSWMRVIKSNSDKCHSQDLLFAVKIVSAKLLYTLLFFHFKKKHTEAPMYQGQQCTEYFHSTISEMDVWPKEKSNQQNLYLTQGISSYQYTKVTAVRNVL